MKTTGKIIVSILIAIVLFGSILRAYHFSDWLRFNSDQVRDAALAINFTNGNGDLPLLGPMAGGTDFLLGPAFNYFQIAAMEIFGATPQAGAYPDLLFGILSIALFFVLAKICFNPKISLALAWLYAISYFTVKYSRFAWNPNSTPFFVMLYIFGIFKLATAEENKKMVWAIIAGAALGIAVQLHTSLLIILPAFTFIAFKFLLKKESIRKNVIVWLIVAAVFMNIPQIISEIKTKGSNSYQFILGATSKNNRNSSFGKNLLLDLSCHIKTNNHILSSLGDENDCDYNNVIDGFKKLDSKKVSATGKFSFLLFFAVSLAFSLGGYFFFFKEAKKGTNEKTRIFLKLTAAYAAMFFLFSILWAQELSIRFLLPVAFVPFILLGFWLQFLSEKTKKQNLVVLAAIFMLSFLNLRQVFSTYKDLRFGGREINGNFEYMTLGEGKYITNFIRENSAEKTAYIDAQAGYLFKFLRPLLFLAKDNNLEIIELNKDIRLNQGDRLFYIKSADNHCELPQKILDKYEIEKCSLYRQFSIFALKVR